MINHLRHGLATALGVALALTAAPALALGLGQIEVKSRRDQPLVAEIPIVSSDPGELEQLQARLASPDTFARIGLEPPQGVVSDLQFAVALDNRGRPVIRVTSAVPVQQPLLTFLVEVDWGEGRLVREYSALLDAPQTVSAPAQPPIQAPVVAPSNTIVREAVVTAPAEPIADAPASDADAVPEPPSSASPEPLPAPDPVASTPAPPPAPTAPASAPDPIAPLPTADTAGEYGPVRRGDTLGRIAGELGGGYSLDQTMLALLRANPDAFIGDNVNLIKQGAVLRVPRPDEISRYSATEAAVVVREHIEQWRDARAPAPQPAALVDAPSSGAIADTTASAAPPSPEAAPARRAAQARLEIVPPSRGGQRAGTRSGVAAGGEGEMLRQEMQQTQETLAARDAEVAELKTRVAELEQLQQQQQQMITLKDSELAAAQQRLATTNQAAATPASATQPAVQGAERTASDSALPWIGGGLGLLLLGVLGWWWSRRGKREAQPAPRGFSTEAMAASIPGVDKVEPAPSAPAPEPTWKNAAPKPVPASIRPAPAPVPAKAAPTWHAGGGAEVAPLNAAPAGNERVELARAYIDLGDIDTARSLLQEVAAGSDPSARDAAARLLQDLA